LVVVVRNMILFDGINNQSFSSSTSSFFCLSLSLTHSLTLSLLFSRQQIYLTNSHTFSLSLTHTHTPFLSSHNLSLTPHTIHTLILVDCVVTQKCCVNPFWHGRPFSQDLLIFNYWPSNSIFFVYVRGTPEAHKF